MPCQRCAGAALTKAGRDRSGRQLYCCGTCGRRQTPHSAAAFGGYRCPDDIIAPVVRWYLRFRLPYGVMRTSRTRPPRPLACAGLGPWPTLALRSAGVRHGHRQPAARVLGRRAAGSPCPGPRAPRLRGPAVCAAWRPHPAPRPLGAPGAPQGPRPAVRSPSFCAQNPTVPAPKIPPFVSHPTDVPSACVTRPVPREPGRRIGARPLGFFAGWRTTSGMSGSKTLGSYITDP